MARRRRKWIKDALRYGKRGILHRQLNIPAGKKIPLEKMRWAAMQGGKLGRRARLALTLRAIGIRRKRRRR